MNDGSHIAFQQKVQAAILQWADLTTLGFYHTLCVLDIIIFSKIWVVLSQEKKMACYFGDGPGVENETLNFLMDFDMFCVFLDL